MTRLAALLEELGLPRDERELGPFVSGLAWGLVVYCVLLVVVSWLTAKAFGWPL